MKIKEIRDIGAEQLKKILDEKRTKLVQLRFDIVTKQIKNNKEHESVRKDIAKILTVFKERAIK